MVIRGTLRNLLRAPGPQGDAAITHGAAGEAVAVEPKPERAPEPTTDLPADALGRVMGYCFVTGAQKSGTTWVGWILREHPEIKVRGEAGYVGGAHDATTWIDESALDRFLQEPSPRRLLGGIERDELLAAAQRGIVESMLRLSCKPDGRTRVLGDRAPQAYCEGVDRLHRLFPDAVYVDVVRDGRDVAVSNAFMMLRNRKWNEKSYGSMAAGEAAHAAHIEQDGTEARLLGDGMLDHYATRWARCIESGRRAKELFGDRCVRLRYEEMLESPHTPVRRLFEALGVASDEATVARCVEAASFESKSGGRKPGEQDAASFVRKGVAGDWKQYFGEREREIFNACAGRVLVEEGYEQSLEWTA